MLFVFSVLDSNYSTFNSSLFRSLNKITRISSALEYLIPHNTSKSNFSCSHETDVF